MLLSSPRLSGAPPMTPSSPPAVLRTATGTIRELPHGRMPSAMPGNVRRQTLGVSKAAIKMHKEAMKLLFDC